MADTTLEASPTQVGLLLKTGAQRKFVIPEYQRPYAWGSDEVNTLFDDLESYVDSNSDTNYFLGCIVECENKDSQEVIDGQQRLTTLFLLLRALHKVLESMSESDERTNFLGQITPSLWKTDPLTAKADMSSVLIESRAIGDAANQALGKILQTGISDPESKDPYSLNYRILQKRIDEYRNRETIKFHIFLDKLLNHVDLLPIKANSTDTALMIFNTLNDRGLSLSDADIFKAKMYAFADDTAAFVEAWQSLSEDAERADQSMQSLFYQYMFLLRAREGDKKTTTPGLRKWFAENNFKRLKLDKVLEELDIILNVWRVAICHEPIAGEPWSKDEKIAQLLDILMDYPNEF